MIRKINGAVVPFGIIEYMKKGYYELNSILEQEPLTLSTYRAPRKASYTIHTTHT